MASSSLVSQPQLPAVLSSRQFLDISDNDTEEEPLSKEKHSTRKGADPPKRAVATTTSIDLTGSPISIRSNSNSFDKGAAGLSSVLSRSLSLSLTMVPVKNPAPVYMDSDTDDILTKDKIALSSSPNRLAKRRRLDLVTSSKPNLVVIDSSGSDGDDDDDHDDDADKIEDDFTSSSTLSHSGAVRSFHRLSHPTETDAAATYGSFNKICSDCNSYYVYNNKEHIMVMTF